MAEKHTRSRRKLRQALIRIMEKRFDFEKIDVQKELKVIRNRTKISGIFAAAVLYGGGFALGYIAWQGHRVDYETFTKLTWILMIPASVVGLFAWMLVSNRREYPLRQQAQDHIDAIELNEGLFWCFEPLIKELLPNDTKCLKMVAHSRDGLRDRLIFDDYVPAVLSLFKAVQASGNRSISEETIAALEENLGQAL